MAQTDIEATAQLTAALFAKLMDKLVEKGVLSKADVEQLLVDATKTLKDPRSAMEELGERDRNDPRSA